LITISAFACLIQSMQCDTERIPHFQRSHDDTKKSYLYDFFHLGFIPDSDGMVVAQLSEATPSSI
jgi:hypothetical protein